MDLAATHPEVQAVEGVDVPEVLADSPGVDDDGRIDRRVAGPAGGVCPSDLGGYGRTSASPSAPLVATMR